MNQILLYSVFLIWIWKTAIATLTLNVLFFCRLWTLASYTTSLVGDCCLEEPGVGHSQGMGVDSEDSHHSGNDVACNECISEKTADNVELEISSHVQGTPLNDNDADLEKMSDRCTVSHTEVEYNHEMQPCLKKSRHSFKQTCTYQTEHHISELRQLGNENSEQRFAVSVDEVCTESPLKLAGLHEGKGECYTTSATDIKVSKTDVENNRSLGSVKSVLGAMDVLPSRKCKTMHLPYDGSMFAKDCASLKQNRHINLEWKNSPNVIRAKKQFGPIPECVVKLERLSPETLIKFLSPKKEHRRSGARSVTEMHHRYKAGKCSYFRKSSGKCRGTKEQTQGHVRFHEDGMLNKQNCDNTWGDTKLDSWGNVRYLREGHGDFSESEEDWHGWWVHVDSVRNLPNARLYSVCDGVKESRTVVWDSAIEPLTATQNKGIQVPEWKTNVCDEEQYNKEGCVSISFDVSDEEGTEFGGW